MDTSTYTPRGIKPPTIGDPSVAGQMLWPMFYWCWCHANLPWYYLNMPQPGQALSNFNWIRSTLQLQLFSQDTVVPGLKLNIPRRRSSSVSVSRCSQGGVMSRVTEIVRGSERSQPGVQMLSRPKPRCAATTVNNSNSVLKHCKSLSSKTHDQLLWRVGRLMNLLFQLLFCQ